MNNHVIILIAIVIISSTVLSIDPLTNTVSFDTEGTSLLYCSVIETITERFLPESNEYLDFLKTKYNC